MKKTQFATVDKKRNPCKNCGAHIINTYDYFNNVYKWTCTGCGAVRYDSGARFETRFQQASEIK